MTRLGIAAILMSAVFARQPLHGQIRSDSIARITLRIYNYADVPADILSRAEQQMDRVYDRFGVGIERLYCPTSSEELRSNRVCSGRLGPNHLVIKLLSDSMSKRYGFRRGIFGIASHGTAGAPGTHVSLFYARVLDLAYYGGVGTGFEDAQAIVLGHMMAHEVGHLLLGPNSHSSKGVMRFPWNRKTLLEMERGRLRFTAQEQSRIRSELHRRLELDRGRPRQGIRARPSPTGKRR